MPPVQTCPEPSVLPIVFVPGIMGSRLRNRATGRLIWDPDNSWNWSDLWPWSDGHGSIARQMRNGPAAKRRGLVGPPGTGFSRRYLEVDRGTPGDSALARQNHARGWGGLHQGSYAGIMAWLQHTAAAPASGQVPYGCFALHYEAWAHPYNWTDDNRESGRLLGATVDAAIADTQARYGNRTQGGRAIRILKPVIVTHSMGGLVARAYTQLHGGAGKVQGVIHGAMPTDGAPATYKRMMAGFEGVSRFALGSNQREVTATAGNCPGPLELLPNTRHKSVGGETNWLRATGRGGGSLWSKPASNPYSEIYTNATEWWRLIWRQYLDPDGDPAGVGAWAQYITQLTLAASYHAALGPSGFHPNTRMFWADASGGEFTSWDRVEWRQVARHDTPPAGKAMLNDNSGRIAWGEWYTPMNPYGMSSPQFLPDCDFRLQPASANGDGTVHAGSGRHVSGPMTVATRRGFGHQHAFDSGEVRGLLAGWLFDMVQEQL